MPIQATIFSSNGKSKEHTVNDVNDTDAEFFIKHTIKLSMEQLSNGTFVVYADYGKRLEDGTIIEAIAMTKTDSCRDTLYHLRTEVEKLL